MGSKYVQLLLLLLCSAIFVMCKNQEKVGSSAPESPKATICVNLTEDSPEHSLFFMAKAESKREEIASQKAQKETVIQLVQFFQSEFIEGGQFNTFQSSERLGNWNQEISDQNAEYRKKWSEVSFEMIGSMHNRGSFTHKKDISKDSSGTFTVTNVLVVNEDWIRDHWKKSLAATDSSLYFRAKESMMHEQLMEMDIKQEYPCK